MAKNNLYKQQNKYNRSDRPTRELRRSGRRGSANPQGSLVASVNPRPLGRGRCYLTIN